MCGAAAAGPVFPFATQWNGQRYEQRACSGCTTTFVVPRPTPVQLTAMYAQDSYHDDFYAETEESSGGDSLAAMVRIEPAGGSLLDYGCGNGDFLCAAKGAGFEATGVELDAHARATAAARSGCPVISPDALFAGASRYDVVRLGDVLEHLPEPTDMMRQLETLVADGGHLVIEGPLENNASVVEVASRAFGALKRLLGKQRDASLPPFHLFRVDARTQRRFFSDRLGYSVVAFDVHETGWPYWIKGDRLSRPHGSVHLLRMIIGLFAIGVARTLTRVGIPIGNRFVATLAIPHQPNASNTTRPS